MTTAARGSCGQSAFCALGALVFLGIVAALVLGDWRFPGG
jgi:hypothetical protein